ncbi:MAG: alpha-L-fucosidase [Pirellulaceae bacterium]
MTHDQRTPNRREFFGRVSGSTAGAVLGAALCGSARATHGAQPSAAKTDRRQTFEPATERTPAIAHYEEFRFGMFIHYTMSTFLDGPFWESFNGPLPPAKKYAPEKLDVDQWISTAARAEMRYAVLLAKHHLGFALWDSKYTGYDVVNSSNTTDVVAEFVKACRKHDVAPGLFYTLGVDAAHRRDGGMTDRQWYEHARNQITELLTDYGPIAVLWLDAVHVVPPARLQEVYETVKSLQPDCLVAVNHGYGANGRRIRYWPLDILGGERSLAPSDGHVPTIEHNGKTYYIPMETCDTSAVGIFSKGWFWEPGEQMKEVKRELLALYQKTRSLKTNLLLNVAPDREGRLPAATVERLFELGEAIRKLEKK